MEETIQFQENYRAYTKDILWMCLPLLVVSFVYYGPRVLLLALLAAFVARVCDWLISFMRSRIYDRHDTSSVSFALLIVMFMPPNVPIYMVVISVVIAVLVAKEAFGGTGHYLFHPAAVGICSAVVCWPEAITQYPPFEVWFTQQDNIFSTLMGVWFFQDVEMINGPSYYLRTTALPPVDLLNLFLGNYAGMIGATMVAVVVACGIFLLVRRRIHILVLLCFLGSMILLTALFPRVAVTPALGQTELALRLELIGYEMLTGGTAFVAVFLANDPTILPKRHLHQAYFGLLLGVFTFVFRYFGVFAIGACFALLVVNALSGSIQTMGVKKPEQMEVNNQ